MDRGMTLRAFALSVALGFVFFLITATTFASLGVVLPAMIAEFKWNWGTAGLGFTMLALLTGVFSPIAATSLERLGARVHYALGGALAVGGYIALSATSGVALYLVATSMLGASFALLANVPGTYIVGRAAPLSSNPIVGCPSAATLRRCATATAWARVSVGEPPPAGFGLDCAAVCRARTPSSAAARSDTAIGHDDIGRSMTPSSTSSWMSCRTSASPGAIHGSPAIAAALASDPAASRAVIRPFIAKC